IVRLRLHHSVMVLLTAALTACGGQPSAASTPTSAVTPVFAFSEAVVGPNRMPIGLIRDGSPVNDPGAKVHVRFFEAGAQDAKPRAEADAVFYGQGFPAAVYVAFAIFDKPGDWTVEVQSRVSGQVTPTTSK